MTLSNDLHWNALGFVTLQVRQQYPQGCVHQLHWSPGFCGGNSVHSHVFDHDWPKKNHGSELDTAPESERHATPGSGGGAGAAAAAAGAPPSPPAGAASSARTPTAVAIETIASDGRDGRKRSERGGARPGLRVYFPSETAEFRRNHRLMGRVVVEHKTPRQDKTGTF